MRLVVYCDYSYRVCAGRLSAELPFALFVQGLAPHCERLLVAGRLDPEPGAFPYRLTRAELVALPHYRSGAHLLAVLAALPRGARRFWRALEAVDVAWILGPNPPQALLFALLALVRRRRLVLGVRQDLPALIRRRHPRRPQLWLAAALLEAAFRLLARRSAVVVVGPELARRYRHARRRHRAYVSLVSERDVDARPQPRPRYEGAPELRMLSVGRLDPEKNPLLLADVLARALALDPRWRLHVCGDGPMRAALLERLAQLGVAERAFLHGYVPIDQGLWRRYRSSHALLHVSHTEGAPQVLLEAFAARLPVVATAVGGVGELVDGRGLAVPPGDPAAAAKALARLVADAGLRERLSAQAAAWVREHTLEAECRRLAGFLAGGR